MNNKIYRCGVCGNVVELLHDGGGTLVCCNAAMNLMEAKTEGEGHEKHVPVVERDGSTVKVKVGSVPHPMEEKHHIEWIEINMVDAGRIAKKYLKPGDAPEVEFHARGETIKIRAYCNLHGLWKAK